MSILDAAQHSLPGGGLAKRIAKNKAFTIIDIVEDAEDVNYLAQAVKAYKKGKLPIVRLNDYLYYPMCEIIDDSEDSWNLFVKVDPETSNISGLSLNTSGYLIEFDRYYAESRELEVFRLSEIPETIITASDTQETEYQVGDDEPSDDSIQDILGNLILRQNLAKKCRIGNDVYHRTYASGSSQPGDIGGIFTCIKHDYSSGKVMLKTLVVYISQRMYGLPATGDTVLDFRTTLLKS